MTDYIISEEAFVKVCKYLPSIADGIYARPLSSALMNERERVLDDYEKWDDCHWTTQRMKEYKESLRSEP